MKAIKWTSSPWGFRQTPLAQQCQWFKEREIDYVCGQFAKDMAGMFDPAISDESITQALNVVESFGLEYASFNTDGDFMVQKGVEDEIALSCARIDRAVKFNPKVIIAFAGWQNRNDEAVYSQVAVALKQVARHAAKYHLPIALENHGGLTTTAEQVNRILDEVNEPNIGVNYDPANFLMYGEDPYRALQEIKHPVVFTHFKSLKKINGKKMYCRISEGEIDYVPILKLLTKKYDGFYALEYEETSDVFAGSEDDLKSLQSCLKIVERG
jgi:sugar phosphate isomerase/epimerase